MQPCDQSCSCCARSPETPVGQEGGRVGEVRELLGLMALRLQQQMSQAESR